MGEYEPDDSRDVTLRPGHEPGGIERTGPREGETRRPKDDDSESKWRDEPPAKGRPQQQSQSQSQGQQQGSSPEYSQFDNGETVIAVDGQGQAQMGYGNARGDDGQMEQDLGTKSMGDPMSPPAIDSTQPGETSPQPDRRARADAQRPLGED